LAAIFVLALFPTLHASSFEMGQWTLSSTLTTSMGGGGVSVTNSGSGSGDIYVSASGSLTGSGTFQDTEVVTISGACSGGGTFYITESDQYSGVVNSTGWADVTIASTSSNAPATATVTCPDPPNPPITESEEIPGNAVSGGGVYLLQLSASPYTYDFPFSGGDFKFTITPSSIGPTSTAPTTTTSPPTTTAVSNTTATANSLGVAVYSGGLTAVNGETGSPTSTSSLSPGDIVQTSANGVVAIGCPNPSNCPAGTAPVTIGAGTTVALLRAEGTTDDVVITPDDSTFCASVNTAAQDAGSSFLMSVKEALGFGDTMSDIISKGLAQPPLEEVAQEHIVGLVDDLLIEGAIHSIKTQSSALINYMTGTPDAVVADPVGEYTVYVSNLGTSVEVYSGSIPVESLTTGQLVLVNASEDVFIPRDPTEASVQNLTQSVEPFNTASLSQWWMTATTSAQTSSTASSTGPPFTLNLPGWLTTTNEGLILLVSSIVILVVSVPLGRKRGLP